METNYRRIAVAAKNIDTREHDIADSDDYYGARRPVRLRRPCLADSHRDCQGKPPASFEADVAAMLDHRAALTPLPSLRSRFLAFAHDDGWYFEFFYAAWDDVAAMLAAVIPPALGTLDMDALQRGGDGYWLQNGKVDLELPSHDIDSVLNRRL